MTNDKQQLEYFLNVWRRSIRMTIADLRKMSSGDWGYVSKRIVLVNGLREYRNIQRQMRAA